MSVHAWEQRVVPGFANAAADWGAVLFVESPWVGGAFVAVACLAPAVACAGLLGQAVAALTARGLSLAIAGNAHRVNGLLVGAYLGALHAFGVSLLAWVLASALLATLLTSVLGGLLWRVGHLPVLSFPFVLVSWLVVPMMALPSPLAVPAAAVIAGDGGLFLPWMDHFFIALGALFLGPTPLAGALIYGALLIASRYLAWLALAGYGVGVLVLAGLGRSDLHSLGFNFMLTTMAVGGIFAVPGRASFIAALAATATTALLTVALDQGLHALRLPLLTLPFVLASWLWFLALAGRVAAKAPALTLDHPRSPETAYEQARLAEARGALLASVPLAPPFLGEWRVSQGFDGRHTHRDAWRHALDFHIVVNGASHAGEGRHAGDFFCFGAPVLAPAAGQIVRARDDLPDMAPGETDLSNNWGNHVLLRLADGRCVLLAHLRQASLAVRVGEWVVAGQVLAACGSSGRSPEPHLHLHVQEGEALGSPTCAFHLVSVLVPGAHGQARFLLNRVPVEGMSLSAAPRDPDLAAALSWPQGRVFRYDWRDSQSTETKTMTFRSETRLLGQTRIASHSGASAAFEVTASVLGLYQREGACDPALDLWLLALGLTPLSSVAGTWCDRPSMRLLPLRGTQRFLLGLLKPLGTGCDSRYTRAWDKDAGGWRQRGTHVLHVLPGVSWHADTDAWIVPGRGVERLRLEMFGRRYEAERTGAGWIAEDGRVRWERPVESPATPGERSVPTDGVTVEDNISPFQMRRVS